MWTVAIIVLLVAVAAIYERLWTISQQLAALGKLLYAQFKQLEDTREVLESRRDR